MTAENIFTIAIHLPEKELERLCIMLNKKVNQNTLPKKRKKSPIITREDAIEYLLKNVFCKKRT